MEDQDPPRNDGSEDESLAERMAHLETRIEHLEKEMKSIAKMEGALTRFLGGGKSGDS